MATFQISRFSDDGEFLAHSSSDGTLRIFETATGILRQEYSSASHLSATTSSLSWSRQKRESLHASPKSKRKRLSKSKSEDIHSDDLKLIALGTTAGTINLYSFAKGTLHSQLKSGHSSQVNDVCWGFSGLDLFTCSDDQHVAQWDLQKGSVKHKWKCDTSSIHSVCQCSRSCLLTASHTIKMWDLETKALLKTFTGHSSPIFCLMPVCMDVTENDDSIYVLSAAVDDRHINVWRCDGSVSKDQNSVASFSVPDEPVSLSMSRPSSTTQSLILSVITRKGVAHLFEHTLNGKKKKPLLSKVLIRAMVSSSDTEGDGTHVAVLASTVKSSSVCVALGNPMHPQFEQVLYDSTKKEIVIPVQAPKKMLTKEEFSQVKKPEIPNHATTLVPADTAPVQASKKSDKKRLRRSSVTELTVEERLNAMSTDTPAESPVKQPPVANTLCRLLQQGLLSGDKKILTGVFQETNQTIVNNTIRRLPVSCIIPLVKEIEKGMIGHAQHACNLSRWTAALITCHTSYILSVPEIINTMNRLHQALVSRQKFFPKMLQLKGRLELVKEKTAPNESEEDPDVAPVLVHQDESDSDDSMVIDGGTQESDENWDDMSDME